MRCVAITAAWWYAVVAIALADGPAASAPRIAVISDADDKDLAALVVGRLSSNPAIALVERDELAKIGDEAKLQQLASKDGVALGRLLRADGIVFLDKRVGGPYVRFTAVNLGYALFDDPVPEALDPDKEARIIAHRVADYAPKLLLLPTQAIPISVLNLRADYATGDSAAVERKLTLFLESRLTALPQYVVLERRHAWSLGFEHALDPRLAPPMGGAFIVDGTLSFPLQNKGKGDLAVHLRLRSPNHQETPVEIHGPPDNLPALVEQIVAAVRKATGGTTDAPPWQAQKEAREYLEEGIWASQHHADAAATEALDSAEMLGETAPDLLVARIAILHRRADDGLDGPDNPLPDGSANLDQRTDDSVEAIREIVRYSDDHLESKLQIYDSNQNFDSRTGEMRSEFAELISKLLIRLDAVGSPRADELRQQLRCLTGYDPLHGKVGDTFGHPWRYREPFADVWAATLEEELAYYHVICTLPNQFIPPILDKQQGEGFCHRFLKTPEAEKKGFAQFLDGLKADPAAHRAYELIMSGSSDDATEDAAFDAYLDDLWNHREEIAAQKEMRLEFTNLRQVPEQLYARNARHGIPLLRYFLANAPSNYFLPYFMDVLWQPEQWTESDASAIWPDYLTFRKRVTEDWKSHNRNIDVLEVAFAPVEDAFQKKFPEIGASSTPQAVPLVVTHFWAPSVQGGGAKVRSAIPDYQVTDDGIILLESDRANPPVAAFFIVSLPGLKTQRIEIKDASNPRSMRAIPGALYAEYYKMNDSGQYLVRYDRKTQVWEEHGMKSTFSDTQFYLAGGNIYMAMEHGGLARYDWDKDEITLLTSGRRKPPQNRFDNAEARVGAVFAGPGNRPCAIIGGGPYFIQDQPGDWQPVFDSDPFTNVKMQGARALVWSQEGEVVLLDPAQAEPQYLMTPAKPHYRKFGPKPVPSMAPWASQAPWDAPEEGLKSNGTRECTLGLHGDDLYVLISPAVQTKPFQLLVYNRKTGRAPREISLAFKMDEATRAQLAPIYDAGGEAQLNMHALEHPGWPFFQIQLAAADQGLCFVCGFGGFWFIPYAEVEKYLKSPPASAPKN